MKKDGRGPAATDSSALMGARVSDGAIRKATGRGWGDWFDLLDAAGAREMTHQQMVAVIGRHEAAGAWWQQMIAVAYERARGMGERHARAEGFSANTCKIIRAGLTRVFAAWTDEAVRSGWLDATGWHVRKATPCRSLRITWKDGRTHLEVHLSPRGEGKTLIQVQHSRLESLEDANRLKAFWGVALERLRELLEPADEPHSLAA